MSEIKDKHGSGKAVISVMITAMLAFTAFALLPNAAVNEDTVLGATEDFDITGLTEAEIETDLQDVIDEVHDAGGGTVTVTGSKTDVSEGIDLEIHTDVTVVWKAVYTGLLVGDYSDNYLIYFYGYGTFEAADGSNISADIPNNGGNVIYVDEGDVKVSGGTTEVIGDDTVAIYISEGNMTITGGTVSATGEYCAAVISCNGMIRVSGGTVQAVGDGCIAIDAAYSDMIMTGGTVYADIDGGSDYCYALDVFYSYVAVRGGEVTATDGKGTGTGDCYAIYIYTGAAAYLDGTCTGDFALDVYSSATGWVAEVAVGWTGTDDGELELVADSGYTGVHWEIAGGLCIMDDFYDYYPIWDETVYDAGDIAVIESMIDNNNLGYNKVPAEGADHAWMVANWPGVEWYGDYPAKRLYVINFADHDLTGDLDLTALDRLEDLYLNVNRLTGLDVSGLTLLKILECQYNELSALNVLGTALEWLECYNNELTGLDVTGLNALEYLDVSWNYIGDEEYVTGAEDLDNFPAAGWDDDGFYFSPQESGTPLTFTYSAGFNIPAGVIETEIVSVNVYGGVSGGTEPYVFTMDGPDWLEIDEDTGIITGTRPASVQGATTADITVTDGNDKAKTITVTIGAVTEPPVPEDDDDGNDNTMLIIAAIAVTAIAAVVAVYVFVLRPKA